MDVLIPQIHPLTLSQLVDHKDGNYLFYRVINLHSSISIFFQNANFNSHI